MAPTAVNTQSAHMPSVNSKTLILKGPKMTFLSKITCSMNFFENRIKKFHFFSGIRKKIRWTSAGRPADVRRKTHFVENMKAIKLFWKFFYIVVIVCVLQNICRVGGFSETFLGSCRYCFLSFFSRPPDVRQTSGGREKMTKNSIYRNPETFLKIVHHWIWSAKHQRYKHRKKFFFKVG